jgi:prepilin-type N-terminal cleavage/methylation domain-containing protein
MAYHAGRRFCIMFTAPFIRATRRRSAFTLVEMLVVIGIIAVLLGILFPVINSARKSAWDANTRSLLQSLEAVINTYQADFNAWPGIMSNSFIEAGNQTTFGANDQRVYSDATIGPALGGLTHLVDGRITMAENLVLSLVGGLGSRLAPSQNEEWFDPKLVGGGARTFNPIRPGSSKAYWTGGDLSAGKFADSAGPAFDSVIPEFIDRYPLPLPVLYLRAGYPTNTTAVGSDTDLANSIIVAGASGGVATYGTAQFISYVGNGTDGRQIGEGIELPASRYKATGANAGTYSVMGNRVTNGYHGLRTIAASRDSFDATTFYPYDAYTYFKNPANGKPRGEGRYLLISAGRDRVYGTDDDITNFGKVTGN